MVDPYQLRKQFPILAESQGAPQLVYLDNAATTHKPQSVIDTIANYYSTAYANVHRGIYRLANRGSELLAHVRGQVQQFIQAEHMEEIIFTSGTTSALNLLATTYGKQQVGHGDVVWVDISAHHSNFLPWERLCQERGAKLKTLPLTANGVIDPAVLEKLICPHTKLLSLSYVSNVLGSVNPIKALTKIAHAHSVAVVVDAAQAVAHLPINVKDLDCDFLTFSAHKLYGPTGVGILYGKQQLLDNMEPYQLGGGMVHTLAKGSRSYEAPPHRFEAGTLPIASIVGMGTALDFCKNIGMSAIETWQTTLGNYLTTALKQIPSLRMFPTHGSSTGIVSFAVTGQHPLDIGLRLSTLDIAVRTGHLCAQPLMDYLGEQGLVRASLAVYNTHEDIDTLMRALHNICKQK